MNIGELEFRSKSEGVEVLDVSFPKRTIEVVVMPYDRETTVEYRGRMVRESCAPGAFDGVQRRPNRVNVYRDHHNPNTVVGKAITFHPSRPEGLVAELFISKTDTSTLTMASEGLLNASAGFGVLTRADGRPGEEWPARDQRRLTWLWLDHVAMVPDPAYPDAVVLDVRSETLTAAPGGIEVATPNLDAARALRLEDLYARVSR